MTNDGVAFNSDFTYCFYTVYQNLVLVNTACQIAISTLSNHLSTTNGVPVLRQKVIAFNKYGDSVFSEVGNGAIIRTYSDAPVDLVEDYSIRTPTSLGFTWNLGE